MAVGLHVRIQVLNLTIEWKKEMTREQHELQLKTKNKTKPSEKK